MAHWLVVLKEVDLGLASIFFEVSLKEDDLRKIPISFGVKPKYYNSFFSYLIYLVVRYFYATE